MTDTEARPSRLGWHSSVPPNGFANRSVTQTTNSNPLGLETPPADDIETTPEHYNLIGGDPACVG